MTKQDVISMIDREIDNLPPIPDNINRIRNLINDPKSSNKSIAECVKRDPALTANLLRVSNSAYYAVNNRIDSVERAIVTIGLKTLSGLLLTIGAKKVMSERYASMESEWEISQKCSVFSKTLLKTSQKGNNNLLEYAFTSGLLHNMGKIIMLSVSPELMKNIESLSVKKSKEEHLIQKMALGMTNAEIGARVAENWKFPRYIWKTIELQDNPVFVEDDDILSLVYSVYLSKRLIKSGLDDDGIEDMFLTLEPKVLQFFKIPDAELLRKAKNSLYRVYEISRKEF